ncbi:MAG: LysM domain-containing protein [Dehalococcoidia bacterium]
MAVPLLSLVLIRMLWSGSSLWFLTVGIILLGAAAIVFLARRTQEHEYSRQTLAPETTRVPLILMGLGVLFLAMLILPNYSGGSSNSERLSQLRDDQSGTTGLSSDVSGAVVEPSRSQQTTGQTTTGQTTTGQTTTGQTTTTGQQTTREQADELLPGAAEVVVDGDTYIVQDGDTLWDIAFSFDSTVEAIVAANGLSDPEDISIGQELTIPAAGAEEAATVGTADDAVVEEPAETLP